MKPMIQASSLFAIRRTLAGLLVSMTASSMIANPSPLFAQIATASQATVLQPVNTSVPRLIRYNGALLDSRGWPITTPTTVTFAIHTQPSGDDQPLWRETQQVTPNSKGGYTVLLGAATTNGLPPEVFQPGESQYLAVQAEGEQEQTRVLLVSVPYALKAGDSATLGGLPASAYALAGSAKAATAATAFNGVQPDTISNVTTTGGTAGYVPRFNGTSTIIDSPIFVSGANVGIGTTNPTVPLEVTGNTVLNGGLAVIGNSFYEGPAVVFPIGTATATTGFNSQPFKLDSSAWNSSSQSAVSPRFQWQAEVLGNNTFTPSATLNLLSSASNAAPAETGFHFNANGTITFAPGQTFPGTGTGNGTITGVTAGTGLTGGGTSGKVTLDVDTTKVPLLASANHFTTSQSVTGNVSTTGQLVSSVATGTAPLAVSSTTVVPNLNASLLGGLAPSALAALALSNSFSATQSFTKIGIGTATPRSPIEVQAAAARALGPVVTLTNTGGNVGAAGAIDFNTNAPSATGTYNPMARITAQDALSYSDNIVFQSNTPGSPNNGLQTNMTIKSNGLVVLGPLPDVADPEPTVGPELSVTGQSGFDDSGATGISVTGGAGFNGGTAIEAFGGIADDRGVTPDNGGTAGIFSGGGEASYGGDGIDAYYGAGACCPGGNGYAGNFQGNLNVSGAITAGTKDFKIDHPLDPANKYLIHSSVESSEMMNIYTGNVVTDELGLATVKLPDWFEAENTDFRYQLTVIGRRAQAWIAEEVAHGQFKIASDATNTKISWQITAVRQDAYARAYPLVVEQQKPSNERGFYIHPELYGQPAEKQTEWGRHPQQMRRMKETRAKQTLHAQAQQQNLTQLNSK
jgi:hypothetical protein